MQSAFYHSLLLFLMLPLSITSDFFEAAGLLQELVDEIFAIFKDFFEDDSIKKVWHNYSFDRHVLWNHGIDCKGFAADTMHMARLWDSSRQGKGQYSLEGLTK